MAIKDALLGEFDHEMKTTRGVLQVVPETETDWRPWPKAYPLASLAAHLANIINWLAPLLRVTELDLGGPVPFQRVNFESPQQLVQRFDEVVATARAALSESSDEALRTPFTLKNAGHVIFTLPRTGAFRSFIMNHHIHHRGQLSVYLRMRGAKLPSIYGPTADS